MSLAPCPAIPATGSHRSPSSRSETQAAPGRARVTAATTTTAPDTGEAATPREGAGLLDSPYRCPHLRTPIRLAQTQVGLHQVRTGLLALLGDLA